MMKSLCRFINFLLLAMFGFINSIYAQSPVYSSKITQNLKAPARIAVDKADNIYVTDASQKLIVKYDTSGNFLETITTGGSPLSLAINENNQLFFGDGETGKIFKLNSNGTPTVIYSGSVFPSSMVFCPDSLLYIVDSKLKEVIVIDQAGNVVRTIGVGTLFYPTGIAYNHKTNNILVSEHGGLEDDLGSIIEKVWMFDLQGNLINSFGKYGNIDGRFYRIQGLTVDRCGNIYVPDLFQGNVSVFNENGIFISKFGLYGEGSGHLNVPLDIAINSKDRIWIASMNNGSVEAYKINFSLPTSNITSGNKTICSSTTTDISIEFTGTSPWTFTYTNNGLNPTTVSGVTTTPYTLTVSQAGTYQVTTLSDSSKTGTCFSGSSTIKIDSIIPTSNITSGNKTICSGQTADITIEFTGTPPWTFTYTHNGLNPTTISNVISNPYILPVSQAGIYQVTALSGKGCSGTSFTGSATVNVNSLPIVSAGIDRTVCSGSTITLAGSGAVSYVWNNGVIDGVAFKPTATKIYTVTGTDLNGCANTDTVLVAVNSATTVTATATICMGSAYTFGTQTLTTTGTYTETFSTANGCDSIVTLTLNVNPAKTGTTVATICMGSTYTFGTQILTTAGVYTETFKTANGCDSIVTLTLSVNPPSATNITTTICQGSTYIFGTQILTTAGVYTEMFTAANGCDSVITLTLNVISTIHTDATITICQGSTYIFGTQFLTTSGVYTGSFTSSNGCDSVVTLTLNVNSILSGTAAATICQGNTFTFGTQTLSVAGTYTETFPAFGGCDSVVTFTLSVNPIISVITTATICQGSAYTFGTQTLTTAGTYTTTFTSANGCDSVVTLTLNVNPTKTGTATATICQGSTFTFGTQILTTTGTYAATFAAANGCDSVVTLTLNVNSPTTGTDAATICQGSTYTFGTQTLTTAGTYTGTFTAINGCDSVVTLTLNVNSPTTGTDVATICQSSTYTFGTQTLTTAGTYTGTFTAANGCDSVAILTLNVNPDPLLLVTSADASCFSCCDGNSSISASGTSPFTYKWSSGGQTTSSVTGLCAGTHTICLTDANGCMICDTVTINFAIGISNSSSIENIFIYPNPTNGSFVIQITGGSSNQYEIEIHNVLGEKVYSIENIKRQVINEIDFSNKQAGVYFIKISSGNGLIGTGKIIVE